MSRRARARRDKRAPIPDFYDQQPRSCGVFFLGTIDSLLWFLNVFRLSFRYVFRFCKYLGPAAPR